MPLNLSVFPKTFDGLIPFGHRSHELRVIMAILFFVTGLIFLIVGAEALVRGASRLAAVIGISPLVIGLTVVAFGTSSPELAVSVKSALSNQASLAVGNVVGR